LQRKNISDKLGLITNIRPVYIHTNDVKLTDIVAIKPSFAAVVGMSGAPLINRADNSLIGLMSFGLPADKIIKDEVFAIDVNELVRRLNATNVKH
jgi:hypothetical protein